MQDTYKISDIMLKLGMSWPTVKKLILMGKLKAINISTGSERGRWRIPAIELDKFLEGNTSNVR